MNILQIVDAPSAELADLDAARPDLAGRPDGERRAGLLAAGLAPGHVLAPALAALGHEADWILVSPAEALPLRRIDAVAPDILYVGDAVRRDAGTLAGLERRPRRVVGWAAAVPPEGTDWTGYDLILTCDPACVERAPALGAGAAALFHAACPVEPPPADPAAPLHDIVFRGTVTGQPGSRLDCLKELAKAPLGFRGECDPVFFLSGTDPEGTDLGGLPAGLHMYNRGRLADWRLAGAVAGARTALLFRDEPPATAEPLALAALSAGTLLLAESGSAAERLFEPGRDFLSFTGPQGLLDALYAHLAAPDAADAMIRRARDRCRDEHGLPARAARFAALLAALDGGAPVSPATAGARREARSLPGV